MRRTTVGKVVSDPLAVFEQRSKKAGKPGEYNDSLQIVTKAVTQGHYVVVAVDPSAVFAGEKVGFILTLHPRPVGITNERIALGTQLKPSGYRASPKKTAPVVPATIAGAGAARGCNRRRG